MKKIYLLLGLLAIFCCKRADEPAEVGFAIRFENPQPINDLELSKIPNKFRGLFMNADSVYFNITDKMILREYYNKSRFHKRLLDSIKGEFYLKGNQYISKFNKDIYDYRYLGDSVEFSNRRIDTFFIFSDAQKAKRIDGQLILNYKDSIYWKIKTISLDKTMLKIKYIYSEEDLKRMDSVTKIKSTMIDSSLFILKPSRNEFKLIINLKKFGDEWEYKKITK